MVFDFLIKRRDFLCRQVRAGLLDLESCGGDPAQIPLVCRDRDYLVCCSSHDLSRAGRSLFAEIVISKRRLGTLTAILYSNEVTDLCIEERNPTAYLYCRTLGLPNLRSNIISAMRSKVPIFSAVTPFEIFVNSIHLYLILKLYSFLNIILLANV